MPPPGPRSTRRPPSTEGEFEGGFRSQSLRWHAVNGGIFWRGVRWSRPATGGPIANLRYCRAGQRAAGDGASAFVSAFARSGLNRHDPTGTCKSGDPQRDRRRRRAHRRAADHMAAGSSGNSRDSGMAPESCAGATSHSRTGCPSRRYCCSSGTFWLSQPRRTGSRSYVSLYTQRRATRNMPGGFGALCGGHKLVPRGGESSGTVDGARRGALTHRAYHGTGPRGRAVWPTLADSLRRGVGTEAID